MVQRRELTGILTFLLPLIKLSCNHLRDELLCLDERYLYVSVWVTVERKLTSNALWKCLKCSLVLCREVFKDILTLCILVKVQIISTMSCEQIIQLLNQTTDSRNKLDKTFWNQNNTEVVTLLRTISNNTCDILNDIIQSLVLRFNFLRYQADVWLSLQSTLKSDVRCRTTHQLDEVPVLTSRVTVTLNVTDKLRVSLSSCIETERSLNLIVLQVAIDSLRATNNLYTILLSCIVFSQHTSISIRVVTTNDYNSLDIQLTKNFKTLLKLFFLLKLCST